MKFIVLLALCSLSTWSQQFVGTSPCGAAVREFLGISKTEPCDKITWTLILSESSAFTLTATYGVQEQSAPGFVDTGKTVTLQGEVKTTKTSYTLKPDKSERTLSLLRVNDNLLQPLGPEGKSLVGNEFWSYTLSRKDAGKNH